jgi:tRNA threonylcarbamoyladenosine biosynthesis protein TsaB
MRILGIDTTTKFLSIGLYDNGRLYEYSLEVGRGLSSLITTTIKRVIEAAGLKIKDLDYFACGLGPGSFTGVRIGLSTMKGFSWSLNKKIIGIPTLDILAYAAIGDNERIIPIVDAKRNLIYTSVYLAKKGVLKRNRPYMLLAPKDFYKEIKPGSLLIGDAVMLYKDDILRKTRGVHFLDKDYWYPKGSSIIKLALERIKAKKFDNPFTIEPIYLYPKECQIRK